MTVPLFGLFLVALLLGAVGQLSMKIGLTLFTDRHGEIHGLGELLRAMVQIRVAFGLGCFVVSSMLYLFVMSKVPLSLLYPMVALNYVFVTILAAVFLHEHVPVLRVAGLAIIILGVLTVAMSYPGPAKDPAAPAVAEAGET